MNKPVQPDRAQQVFIDLQAAARKIVADKLSPAIEFHASRHFFFVHRQGRPELSLDVWLETEGPQILFATNIRAVGHFVIETFAGNENRIRNGDRLMTVFRLFCSRQSLLLDNLALRQQLSVLKRRHPRPRLDLLDRFFWLLARRFWSGWKQALFVVTPETVVRWHRAGFRWYWRVISKVGKPIGRRPISQEVRDLIFQMLAENPTWGAPRIHGELLMLAWWLRELNPLPGSVWRANFSVIGRVQSAWEKSLSSLSTTPAQLDLYSCGRRSC